MDVQGEPLTERAAFARRDEERGDEATSQALGQAREEMVAIEVVEQVGADRVAHQIRAERIFHLPLGHGPASLGDDQRAQLAVQPPFRAEQFLLHRPDRGGPHPELSKPVWHVFGESLPELGEADLVAVVGLEDAQVILDRMPRWNVAEIVEQGAQPG